MYEKEVLELYRYCGICRFPINIDRIIWQIGYNIQSYTSASNFDREKAYEIKRDISYDGFIIRKEQKMYINYEQNSLRVRFTQAHEVGHIVLATKDEEAADNFASTLLAPRPIIYHNKLMTADSIAKYFKISGQAANNAILLKDYKPDKYGEEMIYYFFPNSKIGDPHETNSVIHASFNNDSSTRGGFNPSAEGSIEEILQKQRIRHRRRISGRWSIRNENTER